MYFFRQQLTRYLLVFFLLICTVYSFRLNDLESENNYANIRAMDAARYDLLKQILHRRSLYDPAFSDSWSNYLERKRSLFDPAYSEWANSFKRSDE